MKMLSQSDNLKSQCLPQSIMKRLLAIFFDLILMRFHNFQVAKGGQSLSFYSLPELEEWKQETPNAKSWKVKYYKGLGTSTSKEAKEYFTDMKRHRIKFDYDGPSSDQAIELVSLLFFQIKHFSFYI